MGAVVLTVKASYIASTKYRNKSGNREVRLIKIEIIIVFFFLLFFFSIKPIVQWKMRLPEKKPLVLTDRHYEFDSRISKSSARKRLEPLHVLSQFQN